MLAFRVEVLVNIFLFFIRLKRLLPLYLDCCRHEFLFCVYNMVFIVRSMVVYGGKTLQLKDGFLFFVRLGLFSFINYLVLFCSCLCSWLCLIRNCSQIYLSISSEQISNFTYLCRRSFYFSVLRDTSIKSISGLVS